MCPQIFLNLQDDKYNESIAFCPNYNGYLGGLWLEKRDIELSNKHSNHPSSLIRQLASTKV